MMESREIARFYFYAYNLKLKPDLKFQRIIIVWTMDLFVCFTATMDAAICGAELASGEELGRVYEVEPMGAFEDDPNLTNKRFLGNPTRSYRTVHQIKIIGEVLDWQGHSTEDLKRMKEHLEA